MKRMWIALAVAVVGAGCSTIASGSVPDESPSIEGTIKQATANERGRSIFVEADSPAAGREPAAQIMVPRSARVLVSSGGTVTGASAADLVTGTRVRVWFKGPVAESFPVQAAAGTVLILR